MTVTPILSQTDVGGLFVASLPLTTQPTLSQIQQAMNPALIAAELRQPEGQPLELQIFNLPANTVNQLASGMNRQFAQGQLQISGERVRPWSAYPNQVAWASGTTLTIRWRKGQPFLVPLIWGLVIVIALIGIYFLIQRLMQTPWTLSKASGSGAGAGSPPPSFLGVPDLVWELGLLGIGVIWVGPWVYHEATDWIVQHGRYEQARKTYGAL